MRCALLAGKPPVPVLARLRQPRRAAARAAGSQLEHTPHESAPASSASGFGGLALAIRLQSPASPRPLVEARDKPGGRAYFWERDGFTFDAGPTVITDPACLQELWALSGHDMAEDVELMPVMPFYRLNWPDGTNFDYSNDEAALRREIARSHPDDLAGYDDFLRYSAGRLPGRLCQAGRSAVPRFRQHDQGRPGAGPLSGLALGLFDGLQLT